MLAALAEGWRLGLCGGCCVLQQKSASDSLCLRGNGYLLDKNLEFSEGAIVLVPLVIGKSVKRQSALQVRERFLDAMQVSNKALGMVRVAN